MTSRPLRESDIPILQDIAVKSGFPYPNLDHPHIEAVEVATDSEGHIIMACAAKRLVELYLYVDQDRSSAVKMSAIRQLHQGMAEKLRAKGYDSAEIFIPPAIEKSFGRRLIRSFQWVRNWPSFCKRF